MTREREEAIKQLKWYFEEDDGIGAEPSIKKAYEVAIEALKEEPRIKAKWLPYEYGDETWHKCSNCGKPTQYQHFYRAFDGKEHLTGTEIQNYCRYCGAIMEGQDE